MAQAANVHTLIPAQREPIASTLDAIVHNAGDKLKALTMTRIVGGEADMSDAKSLVTDLLDIARIIDLVIAAIGEYADSHIGRIDQKLFTDQLLGALQGNATFEIMTLAQEREDARHDDLYHNGGYAQSYRRAG